VSLFANCCQKTTKSVALGEELRKVSVPEVRTERLVLRGWADADRPAYAAINADPNVMATIGPLQTRAQTDAAIDRMMANWAENGFGLWCVDLDGQSIGFTGLNRPWFEAAFTPCVEVGWRLSSAHWGHGYAPEAGRAALDFGFDVVGLHEIVSFTAAVNHKSRRVMEKLGMARDRGADFDHPSVPKGDPLRPHVLYRLSADQHCGVPSGS
jgi:RimJ/RimL family protein N-acetyltransferase